MDFSHSFYIVSLWQNNELIRKAYLPTQFWVRGGGGIVFLLKHCFNFILNDHLCKMCFVLNGIKKGPHRLSVPLLLTVVSHPRLTFPRKIELFAGFITIYEPVHEISNNLVCATSKASDQPAHTHSLIRACANRLNILWLLSYWRNITWSF